MAQKTKKMQPKELITKSHLIGIIFGLILLVAMLVYGLTNDTNCDTEDSISLNKTVFDEMKSVNISDLSEGDKLECFVISKEGDKS